MRLDLDAATAAADGGGRALLAGFLADVAAYAAAGRAGGRHPVVTSVRALAAAAAGPGPAVTDVRLDADGWSELHGVLLAAWRRSQRERAEVEPAVRRLLAAVERQAYPGGYRPPPPPWDRGELVDGPWEPAPGWGMVPVEIIRVRSGRRG